MEVAERSNQRVNSAVTCVCVSDVAAGSSEYLTEVNVKRDKQALCLLQKFTESDYFTSPFFFNPGLRISSRKHVRSARHNHRRKTCIKNSTIMI